MVKKKLTNKQVRNQDKIQQDRINRALKSEQKIQAQLESGELGPEQTGLLVAHHGVHLIVEDEQRQLHQCKSRKSIEALVTGDRVIWRAFKDGTGVIVAMLPRTHVLTRPTGRTVRPMAANVDQMVIVIAPEPLPNATTLDRYLVISELLQLKPLIVTNKTDLLDKSSNEQFNELTNIYQNLGYDWVHVSQKKKEGLSELQDKLKNTISVFVGQSGVGKSSLISELIPDADIQIGKLSDNTLLGRHTTTCARLYHLPEGGSLIDSPGIRRFGLWHLSSDSLIKGFKEFAPFIGQCKYRNCKHDNEPGCALYAAAKEHKIHVQRIHNYHELMKSHAKMQPDKF